MPGWLNWLFIWLLVSVQGMFSGWWNWALCRALPWAWSLLRILSPFPYPLPHTQVHTSMCMCVCALERALAHFRYLSNKYINKILKKESLEKQLKTIRWLFLPISCGPVLSSDGGRQSSAGMGWISMRAPTPSDKSATSEWVPVNLVAGAVQAPWGSSQINPFQQPQSSSLSTISQN